MLRTLWCCIRSVWKAERGRSRPDGLRTSLLLCSSARAASRARSNCASEQTCPRRLEPSKWWSPNFCRYGTARQLGSEDDLVFLLKTHHTIQNNGQNKFNKIIGGEFLFFYLKHLSASQESARFKNPIGQCLIQALNRGSSQVKIYVITGLRFEKTSWLNLSMQFSSVWPLIPDFI